MKRLIIVGVFSCFFIFSAFASDDIDKEMAVGDSLFQIFDNNGALKAYLNVYSLDSLNYDANW